MSPDWLAFLGVVVVALISNLLPGLLHRRKTGAEARKEDAGAANLLLQGASELIDDLREQVREMREADERRSRAQHNIALDLRQKLSECEEVKAVLHETLSAFLALNRQLEMRLIETMPQVNDDDDC